MNSFGMKDEYDVAYRIMCESNENATTPEEVEGVDENEQLDPESEKKVQSALDKYINGIESSQPDDKNVQETLTAGKDTIAEMSKDIPSAMTQVWDYLVDGLSLAVDYCTGTYTEVQWSTVAKLIAAIAYVVSPVDLIPDVIPVVGFVDDAYVVKLVIGAIRGEIDAYRQNKPAEATDEAVA